MSTPGAHALLSPSAANQWLHCPPSIRFSSGMHEGTSSYAEEGTLAHAMGELYLRQKYIDPGMTKRSLTTAVNKLKKSEYYAPDMDGAVEDYVDLVTRVVLSYPVKPHIALETKLDLSEWAPESFGRADCIIIGGDTLHVIDYKHGANPRNRVQAENNPQIRMYSLGAYREYSLIYPIQRVVMHICQPRLGNLSEETLTLGELLAWGESIKPTAQQAFNGEGEFCPGDWCQWCLAKGVCRPRAFHQLALEEQAQKSQTNVLTPVEIGDVLLRGANLAAWLKDLEAYAKSAILAGTEIPGWKVVATERNRKFTDTDKAYEAAIAAGIDRSLLYTWAPIPLTKAEELLKKKEFEKVLGPFVIRPAGDPALVKESDKRPAITGRPTAQEDFAQTE